MHDIDALKKWNEIPKVTRKRILNAVFCGNCHGSTTVVDYSITDLDGDVYIKGKCKKCGHDVARLLD